MEVSSNENEAPCSIRRLAEALGKRKWYKDVSRWGISKKKKEIEKTIIEVQQYHTAVTQYFTCGRMKGCQMMKQTLSGNHSRDPPHLGNSVFADYTPNPEGC